MENIIEVQNIRKYYKAAKRNKGFWNTLQSLMHREYETKKAVNDILYSYKNSRTFIAGWNERNTDL